MAVKSYEEQFAPIITELDEQAKLNTELYNEVHKSLEKDLNRLNGERMIGSTSPSKSIAETGKVLSEIRGTQVNIIKEKSNVIKTIADLQIRERNSKSQETDAGTNQFLMQNLLNEISRKIGDVSKPSISEIRDTRGKEALDKLDPEALGMNDNDFAMIDKFKQASGK